MTTNELAYLAMISACEVTTGPDGYRALCGYTPTNGRVFSGFATHPHIYIPYTTLDGTQTRSSAAGRYQIIYSTFLDLQAKLGTTDFSPDTQDRMALRLISEAGAADLVQGGFLLAAINMTGGIWASLPSSQYAQPKRSFQFAADAYSMAGGVLA